MRASLVGVVVDDTGGLGGELGAKQLDEVHLSAGERVANARAGDVALRPGARIDGAVIAGVDVVVQPVNVVLVEDERSPSSPPLSAIGQRRPVVWDDGHGGRRRRWSFG